MLYQHTKESKNLIKYYRPISLFPIFSKILEGLIFNSVFNYFRQNNLFTECQFGFIPGDSCVAQLLSITNEIHQSFDCSPTRDITGFYLNISKAFNKVWHDGLLSVLWNRGESFEVIKKLVNGTSTKSCFKRANFHCG